MGLHISAGWRTLSHQQGHAEIPKALTGIKGILDEVDVATIIAEPESFGLSFLDTCSEQGCASSHPNLNALKASVECEWALISDSNLVGAIKAFRSRLEKCLADEGGVFEK